MQSKIHINSLLCYTPFIYSFIQLYYCWIDWMNEHSQYIGCIFEINVTFHFFLIFSWKKLGWCMNISSYYYYYSCAGISSTSLDACWNQLLLVLFFLPKSVYSFFYIMCHEVYTAIIMPKILTGVYLFLQLPTQYYMALVRELKLLFYAQIMNT